MDGFTVGSTVGCDVGNAVGLAVVGSGVGLPPAYEGNGDGSEVGCVGVAVGNDEGITVGWKEREEKRRDEKIFTI